MSELDTQALQTIRDDLSNKLQAYERRRRFMDVANLMMAGMQQVNQASIDELVAGPKNQVKESALAFERSVEELPEKMALTEGRTEALLASARQRTRALEAWLESLE